MGDSLPPPAEFDLVDSFARRRGADAEIVLAEPKTDLAGGGLTVRLALGKKSIDADAEATDTPAGRRLVVRVPRSRLSDGTWSLAVVRPGDDVAPLAARLLVQGERPLVLLWGAKAGDTHVPTPRAEGGRGAVLRTGIRAANRLFDALPEKQGKQARRKARALARKVVG